MAGDASLRRLIQTLIFGAYTVDKDVIEQDLDRRDEESRAERAGNGTAGSRRPSAYLDCLEQMINTVFTHEKHLLTDQEWSVFSKFASLSYDTRYVISRLVLRKPNQWLAVSSPGIQKYKGEIGEKGLQVAIEHLCRPLDDLLKDEDTNVDVLVKQEDEQEIIDLTLDSDDEDVQPTIPIPPPQINAVADPSRPPTVETVDSIMNAFFEADADELKVDYLCESEEHMSQEEILNRLTVDQLKLLLKQFKCTPKNLTKPTMISSLLRQTTTQSVLGFLSTKSPKGEGKAPNDHLRQTKLPFAVKKFDHNRKGKSQNQEARLKETSTQMLGKCVRVNYNFYRLVRRLHIINFRSTEHPTSLLLPALLTRFNKRVYPEYSHTRNGAIWVTCEDLLEYEQALALEAKIDELLEAIDADARAKAKTPTPPKRDQFVTPTPPAVGGSSATPLKTPVNASTARRTVTPGCAMHKMEMDEGEVYEISDTPTIQKAKILKEIYEKWIKALWEGAVMAKQERNMERNPALERFEPGYVYTRIVNKTVNAYGSLKEYQAEFDTIQALLSQRFWRRGKRGKWYKRRALIQTDYLSKDPNVPKVKDRNILVQAYDGLLEALNDEDTGLVWRPNLVSRIRKLEKVLKIAEPVEVQDKLRKAESITIKAARVPAVQLDGNGRPVKGKENTPPAPGETISSHFLPVVKKPDPEFTKPKPKTGKSSWKGRDGEIINVETCALEYYEDQGFKGFHSETHILTTIFALLFWDIIFTDIPGAFETAYQSAPLDMAEDSFYYARKDLIDARLRDIKSGKAREILKKHDEKYREKNVWCIGVRWDMCERSDLVEIVECLGGPSLAIICRLFCEDYAGRNSGVPDLIVWNAEKRLCKFVEVKGPGDRPQENQKLWFDTLLGAGAAVEICLVVDEKEDDKPPTARKRKRETPTTSSARKSKKVVRDIESENEGELDYDQFEPEESDDNKLPAVLSKHRRIEAPEGYVENLSLPFPSKVTPLWPPVSTPARPVNRVQALTTTPVPVAGSC